MSAGPIWRKQGAYWLRCGSLGGIVDFVALPTLPPKLKEEQRRGVESGWGDRSVTDEGPQSFGVEAVDSSHWVS